VLSLLRHWNKQRCSGGEFTGDGDIRPCHHVRRNTGYEPEQNEIKWHRLPDLSLAYESSANQHTTSKMITVRSAIPGRE
jgi:hypothetical protein